MNGTLVQVLRWALGTGCLALLWQIADGATALRYLAGADATWIAAALILLTLQTLLSALRWRLTARQLGIGLERNVAVREYYLSQLVNQLLPGGVLGDAGRAVRARAQAGLVASGQAVVFERLAGQLGLLAVFASGVIGTSLVSGGFDAPGWLLQSTLAVALAAVALTAACLGALQLQTGLARRIPERALSALRLAKGFAAAFVQAVAGPQVRGQQCLMSLGTALCNVAAFACCAMAVGAVLPAPAALVLVPLILLTMLIPITPSGWGLREGAAAAVLPLAGVSGAEGLAASIAFGLVLLVSTLPGLIALALATAPGPVKP